MPFGQSLEEQTSHGGCGNLIDLTLYASRTPDLDTQHRVFLCYLEITQMVECACQSAAGSYGHRRVILLLCQRVNPFGDLHCRTQLVVDRGIAPLTYQRHIEMHWPIERMTRKTHKKNSKAASVYCKFLLLNNLNLTKRTPLQ